MTMPPSFAGRAGPLPFILPLWALAVASGSCGDFRGRRPRVPRPPPGGVDGTACAGSGKGLRYASAACGGAFGALASAGAGWSVAIKPGGALNSIATALERKSTGHSEVRRGCQVEGGQLAGESAEVFYGCTRAG